MDSYEFGYDIDPEEVWIFNEGFTWVEVRTEGTTYNIVIPLDRDLLVNTESVVPSLGPLCSNAEYRTLRTLDDAALSLGISNMALRVSFWFFKISFLTFSLFPLCCFFY